MPMSRTAASFGLGHAFRRRRRGRLQGRTRRRAPAVTRFCRRGIGAFFFLGRGGLGVGNLGHRLRITRERGFEIPAGGTLDACSAKFTRLILAADKKLQPDAATSGAALSTTAGALTTEETALAAAVGAAAVAVAAAAPSPLSLAGFPFCSALALVLNAAEGVLVAAEFGPTARAGGNAVNTWSMRAPALAVSAAEATGTEDGSFG